MRFFVQDLDHVTFKLKVKYMISYANFHPINTYLSWDYTAHSGNKLQIYNAISRLPNPKIQCLSVKSNPSPPNPQKLKIDFQNFRYFLLFPQIFKKYKHPLKFLKSWTVPFPII